MAKGLIQTANWRSTTLIVSETALIIGAVAVSVYLRVGGHAWPAVLADMLPKALVITSICQVCLYYGDLYDNPHVARNRAELLIRTLQALGVTLLILAAVYTLFPQLTVDRGVLAPAAALAVGAVVAWRFVFGWVTVQVGPRERLLLVGKNASALALARELHERTEAGVRIVGYVDPDANDGGAMGQLDFLGTVEDIPALVRARGVDRVVVSLVDARGKLPMDKLLDMKLDGVRFDHFASVYEEYTGKIAVENLRPSWLIFSSGFRKSHPLLAVKRGFDIGLSLVGLLLALPMMAIIYVVVRVTSDGPALYHQERVGLNGRIFFVHKFRTMRLDAEAATGPVWSSKNDVRITAVGRVLRRTRLDELPQLWNVLTGEMSFVGPRPERPSFVEQLTATIPFYGQRHVVKPGLTGWAQVRYTYGASVEDAIEKLQYDLYYIKNLSFALDLVIVLETIKTVILRRGAQ